MGKEFNSVLKPTTVFNTDTKLRPSLVPLPRPWCSEWVFQLTKAGSDTGTARGSSNERCSIR